MGVDFNVVVFGWKLMLDVFGWLNMMVFGLSGELLDFVILDFDVDFTFVIGGVKMSNILGVFKVLGVG